ncbi:MAG: hypothetical protein AAGC86_04030 [Pseudomonadota bacterium]
MFIFDTHPVLTVAALLLHGLLASLLAWGLARYAVRRWGSDCVPVAPYFVTVTTLLAIVFAFLASDIWFLNREAGAASRAEEEALTRLANIASEIVAEEDRLATDLRLYAHQIVTEEWGRTHNRFASDIADSAIVALRQETTRLSSTGLPQAVGAELFRSIDALSEARQLRLHIGSGHGDAYRWSLILILSVFSHIAVAFVHGDRPKALILSLAVFSLALSTSICVMAIYDSPYFGVATVQMPDLVQIVASSSRS